jgi:hypothetical protein
MTQDSAEGTLSEIDVARMRVHHWIAAALHNNVLSQAPRARSADLVRGPYGIRFGTADPPAHQQYRTYRGGYNDGKKSALEVFARCAD